MQTELIARIVQLETEKGALIGAAAALVADVKRRYPGEELRCQYMRALDAALTKAEGL